MLQFFAQLAGLPFGEGIEERVECGAVVHFFRMGKFVEYHVVGQMRRQKHQIAGQADCFCRGTTSPSRFCSGDAHFPVRKIESACPFFEQGRQEYFRAAF